jgi:hypothetical protein
LLDAGGRRDTAVDEPDRERAPVARIELALDKPTPFETIENAGQGRGPLPRRRLRLRDRAHRPRLELGQGIDLTVTKAEISELNGQPLEQPMDGCLQCGDHIGRGRGGHVETYDGRREEAECRIAARDPDDWPTVALGLPIWSQDKDLTSAGLDVVTTGDLLDALRDAGQVE